MIEFLVGELNHHVLKVWVLGKPIDEHHRSRVGFALAGGVIGDELGKTPQHDFSPGVWSRRVQGEGGKNF